MRQRPLLSGHLVRLALEAPVGTPAHAYGTWDNRDRGNNSIKQGQHEALAELKRCVQQIKKYTFYASDVKYS